MNRRVLKLATDVVRGLQAQRTMPKEARLLMHKALQADQGEVAEQLQLMAPLELEAEGMKHSRDPASDRALIADGLRRRVGATAQSQQKIESFQLLKRDHNSTACIRSYKREPNATGCEHP